MVLDPVELNPLKLDPAEFDPSRFLGHAELEVMELNTVRIDPKSAIITQQFFFLKNINIGIKNTQNFMLISNPLMPAF